MCRQGFPMCSSFSMIFEHVARVLLPSASHPLPPSLDPSGYQSYPIYTHPHHSRPSLAFSYFGSTCPTQARPDITCQKGHMFVFVCVLRRTHPPADYKLLYRCEEKRIDRGATSQYGGKRGNQGEKQKYRGEEKNQKPCGLDATNRITKQVTTNKRRRGRVIRPASSSAALVPCAVGGWRSPLPFWAR